MDLAERGFVLLVIGIRDAREKPSSKQGMSNLLLRGWTEVACGEVAAMVQAGEKASTREAFVGMERAPVV